MVGSRFEIVNRPKQARQRVAALCVAEVGRADVQRGTAAFFARLQAQVKSQAAPMQLQTLNPHFLLKIARCQRRLQNLVFGFFEVKMLDTLHAHCEIRSKF